MYVREKNPDTKISMFYIDIRSPGILEDFYLRVQNEENTSLIRGKVARINEDPETKNLIVEAEDTNTGTMVKESVEMVVLATGLTPTTVETKLPLELEYDDYGFITSGAPGVYAAGCSKRPVDVSTSVQDSTGVALKAIQSIVKGRPNG
jgi:quinone-modifying oxidoreductase subunit QmoA